MPTPVKICTCLWFDDKGEEAANFYVSLLENSHIDHMVRPDPDGPPLVILFTLAGAPYMILNASGSQADFNDAMSISVTTENQADTDRLWAALLEGGGIEKQCGWIRDRYGLSWQIVPEALPKLMNTPDQEAAGRVQAALMTMKKIDIAELEAAFHNR